MREIVGLFCALILLSICCFAQTATPSSIHTAGGFLDVCGLKDTQMSKESMDAVAKAPTGEVMDTIKKAMAEKSADASLCLGYLTGLFDGWKEGHEHGVLAAQFPAGVPRDLSTAFKSLSDKELQAASAAMKNDVPCVPDHITIGEVRDVAVKYIREQVEKFPLSRVLLTSRLFPLALRDAFPCPAAQPARLPSNGVK